MNDSPSEDISSPNEAIDLANLQAQEQNSTSLPAQDEPTRTEANEVLREKQIANQARQQYIDLQKFWSRVAFWLLCVMVVAQIAIISLIGLGILKYVGFITTLNLFFGQTFLQIIGLAYVVVKFLFPPGSGIGLQSSMPNVPQTKKTKKPMETGKNRLQSDSQ